MYGDLSLIHFVWGFLSYILYGDFSHTFCMGIYLSYILYGDFSHTFCMGISLIHFVWDSTFFLLKSGPSSGTGKAPIAEGRALLEVEVLRYLRYAHVNVPYKIYGGNHTR